MRRAQQDGCRKQSERRCCSGGAKDEISQAERAVHIFLLAAAGRISQHLASLLRHIASLNASGTATQSVHPSSQPNSHLERPHRDQQHPPAPALPAPCVHASALTAHLCTFASPAPGRVIAATKISGLLNCLLQEFSYPFQ